MTTRTEASRSDGNSSASIRSALNPPADVPIARISRLAMFPVSIRCLSEKTVSPQGRFPADEAEARELSLCARGHSVNDGKDWYTVFCFAEPEHAAKFMARFGGERFDPTQ